MNYPNWFISSLGPEKFNTHLHHLKDKPIRALQIGAYTGDASKWLLDNILTHPDSLLDDIDTWEGSDEPVHKSFDWKDVETTYLLKNKVYIDSGKLVPHKTTSDQYFKNLDSDVKYDFIYIDGDHKASTVLRDAINSLEHLNKNGIIAFNDYQWSLHKGPAYDPKAAIDGFCLSNEDILDILEVSHQVWVKLKSNTIKKYRVGG